MTSAKSLAFDICRLTFSLCGFELRELGQELLLPDGVEADGDLVVVRVFLDRQDRPHAEGRVLDAHPGTQAAGGRLVFVLVRVARALFLELRASSLAAARVGVRPELVVGVRE